MAVRARKKTASSCLPFISAVGGRTCFADDDDDDDDQRREDGRPRDMRRHGEEAMPVRNVRLYSVERAREPVTSAWRNRQVAGTDSCDALVT